PAEPPPGASAPAGGPTVRPALERTIDAKPAPKPGKRTTATSSSKVGKPAMAGQKIPEALKKQLEKQLEARVERDVSQIKHLRGEAIGLLTTFVAETPREAREMPEAMLRLGELKWELEREQFVERFRAWEAKPVDQRGPTPEPNFAPSRDLFG